MSPNKLNDKLFEIFTCWIDKYSQQYNDQKIQDLDVVNLAILLKTVGFHLDSFEHFNDDVCNNSNTDSGCNCDLSVELKCNSSKIRAKLSLKLVNCTCPTVEDFADNSFWEVQGTKPSSSEAACLEKSCTLIPEISKKCSQLSLNLIDSLFAYYKLDSLRASFASPNTAQENTGKSSNGLLTITPKDTKKGYGENNSTPLSSLNVTLVNNLPSVQNLPKICVETHTTPPAEGNLTASELALLKDGACPNESFLNSTKENNKIITSSPNSGDDHSQMIPSDCERDAQLIHILNSTRESIDSALLVLKCNLTRDISSKSSILTVTPHSNTQFKLPTMINRRITIGTPLTLNKGVNKKFTASPRLNSSATASIGMPKVSTSLLSGNRVTKKISSPNTSNSLPDTPRPTVMSSKKLVKPTLAGNALRRSGSSIATSIRSTAISNQAKRSSTSNEKITK